MARADFLSLPKDRFMYSLNFNQYMHVCRPQGKQPSSYFVKINHPELFLNDNYKIGDRVSIYRITVRGIRTY